MTDRSATVLVGIDGSEGSADAVRWAARLAAGRNLRLELVHCVPIAALYYGGGPVGSEVLFDQLREDGDRIAAQAHTLALDTAPSVQVRTEVCLEPAPAALIERSRGARMLVLGRTGTGGFTGMLLGSTVATVTSHARCPVTVVRGRPGGGAVPQEGPVVVGVDGSPAGEAAIAAGFEEAAFRRAPLVAVHAWADGAHDAFPASAGPGPRWETLKPAEERLLAQRLAGWPEKYPEVPVERELVRDRPRNALLDASARAQLLVVGSRGRGGFTGMLLGSTSQAVIHHAGCPVLVTRPETSW